jgi:hypothetical protein
MLHPLSCKHDVFVFRYGSHLVLVESYDENNATATLAARSIGSPSAGGSPKYWLGLTSLDDLRTNTLEAAAGLLVSQYSGEFNDCICPISMQTSRNISKPARKDI